MAADFWTVEFKINFNNVAVKGTIGEAFGWTEKYYLPGTKGSPPYTEAIRLQAARAALMAQNVNIVKTSMRLASMYKDQWNIPPTATYPLFTWGDLQNPDGGYCGTVQDALLIRFESDNGRRWNRVIRGIRDNWTDDQSWLSDLTRYSYGAVSPPDLAIPALLTVGGTPGVNGGIAVTVAAGAVTTTTIGTAGSGISINGSDTGTFPIVANFNAYFSQLTGGTPTTINVTLTGGVITAVTSTAGTATYGPDGTQTFVIESQIDAQGLPWFLDDVDYLLNFCGCLTGAGQKIANFHTALVTPAGPDAGRWPAGSLMPVVDQTAPRYSAAPYYANRFMVERVSNRQTGRIWTAKKARKKVAR